MSDSTPFVLVLGIAQDGGFPHAGCRQTCCSDAWLDHQRRRHVTSVAVVDPEAGQSWLVDCTPDFPQQLNKLQDAVATPASAIGLDGIVLTHAHIGHYTGLVHLGRECLDTRQMPVHAMPRMTDFLKNNGPWNQLLEHRNIEIHPLVHGKRTILNKRLGIRPFLVPHRGEYSETIGLQIDGPNRTVLFIPDIDHWNLQMAAPQPDSIEDLLQASQAAMLDATFFSESELAHRDPAQVPHPLVSDSIKRFETLDDATRGKIHWIHLNHTNPLLDKDSEATRHVQSLGFNIAFEGQRFAC
mgnify:CR=1 FL=1